MLIIVVIIILILIYFYFNSPNKSVEKLNNTNDMDEIIDNYDYLDELLNNKELNVTKRTNKVKSTDEVKPYFIDKQFHEDYRDTITAFDHLLEYDKPKFNKACLPVTYTETNKSEIKQLLKSFLKMLNNEIENNVHNYVTVDDGFQNSMPNPTVRSGWERQLENLGLPGELFRTKLKSKIKIIKVDKVEKVESDSQVKYTVYMIIQKLNVSDQMVVKISFVMDRQDLNVDRDFFKNDTQSHIDSISKVLWKNIHQNLIEPFAEVSYGYSITCHKAQGSNFYNVYIDANDIMKNMKENEMKRCLYTAFTRTVNNLRVLI